MNTIKHKDTRYFIEIDLETLELIRVGLDQKQNLDKGIQKNPEIHRLFLSNGQYNKFISRCGSDLKSILGS